MHDSQWSSREKKIAHRVFEAALQQEFAETMTTFKAMAARAENPDDMWAVESWLTRKRLGIDSKYGFRYSQLLSVFGNLLREGRITRQQIEGLAEDKRSCVERIATF